MLFRSFYGNLLKERCGIVEKVGISCDENNKLNDVFDDDERGQGDEYTVVSLHGVAFAVWDTSNTLKILRDASSETGGIEEKKNIENYILAGGDWNEE